MSLPAEERLARARELYAAAGFSDEQPLQITLLYDAGDFHETIALAVSEMWREHLGIDVRLDKREWQYFLATRHNRAEWQVMRFAWVGDFDHPAAFAEGFIYAVVSGEVVADIFAGTGYDHQETVEQALIKEAGIDAVRTCIDALAQQEERQAIALYYLVGKVYREIGDILGRSTSTAKNYVTSAREKVKRCLEGKGW